MPRASVLRSRGWSFVPQFCGRAGGKEKKEHQRATSGWTFRRDPGPKKKKTREEGRKNEGLSKGLDAKGRDGGRRRKACSASYETPRCSEVASQPAAAQRYTVVSGEGEGQSHFAVA